MRHRPEAEPEPIGDRRAGIVDEVVHGPCDRVELVAVAAHPEIRHQADAGVQRQRGRQLAQREPAKPMRELVHLVAHRPQHHPRVNQIGDGNGFGFAIEFAARGQERCQAIEHRLERAEVAALAPPSGHAGGQRKHLAAAIAGGFEKRAGPLERLAAGTRIAAAAGHAEPVGEPRVVAHGGRQRLDPAAQRLAPPGRDQARSLAQDELAHPRPCASLHEALHRLVDEAARQQQFGGFADEAGVAGFTVRAKRAMLQERAKQGVKLEALAIGLAARDEQVAALEIRQQVAGVGPLRDALRVRGRDARQVRQAQQHLAYGLRAGTEHLFGEVVENRLQVGGRNEGVEMARLAQTLEQQHQAGRPAARLFVQPTDEVAGKLAAVRDDDRADLVASQLQRFPAEKLEPARGAQPCERCRGIRAADADEAAGRPLPGRCGERPVQRRAGGQLLVVVEDDHAPAAELGVQPAKEAQSEARAVARVLDRMQRESFGAHSRHRGCRHAQVVEEGGRVAVGALELEPWRRAAAPLEPARHDRGLARTRGRRDPDDGAPHRVVEGREEPVAPDDGVGTRTDQPGHALVHGPVPAL